MDVDRTEFGPQPDQSPARLIVRGVIAELRGDRANMLGALGVKPHVNGAERRAVAKAWSFPAVHERLKAAAQTIDRMPAGRLRPREYGNAMPTVLYDFSDVVGWYDDKDKQSGERGIPAPRVRITATPAEIERMEQALQWPGRYLRDKPEIAIAVNQAALWAARGQSFERMARRAKIQPRVFHARWIFGLRLIAIGLNRDKVAVT